MIDTLAKPARDEALAYVRKQRPQARPEPNLMALLADWERVLRNR